MVNVHLYSAIITKVFNALNTLVSGEKPGFQALSKGLVVLLCAEVVRQRVPDHGAVTHITCRLTAKNWDQLRNPTLGTRVWATFTFFIDTDTDIDCVLSEPVGSQSQRSQHSPATDCLLLQ